MASRGIASRLASMAEEDLALFGRFLELCRAELACLSRPKVEGLDAILREKDSLMKKIAERGEEAAPLWRELEGSGGPEPPLGDLTGALERIREKIDAIQRAEEEIARRLRESAEGVSLSLSSLRRGGKAVSAYQPFRRYAPRFVDRKG